MGPGADLALVICTTALISSKFGDLVLLREQLAIPVLQIHLDVFLSLNQSKFSLGGSPAVLFVRTGNLILVGGRVANWYGSLKQHSWFSFL